MNATYQLSSVGQQVGVDAGDERRRCVEHLEQAQRKQRYVHVTETAKTDTSSMITDVSHETQIVCQKMQLHVSNCVTSLPVFQREH